MKIYCDMDGVLCDFVTHYMNYTGCDKPTMEWLDKTNPDAFWENCDENYWSSMPWTKDGLTLWNAIKDMAIILTAPPKINSENAVSGKSIWIERELGYVHAKNAIIDRDKAKYARHGDILIDDAPKNITNWENSGGFGILHDSAENTLKELIIIMAIKEAIWSV